MGYATFVLKNIICWGLWMVIFDKAFGIEIRGWEGFWWGLGLYSVGSWVAVALAQFARGWKDAKAENSSTEEALNE